MKKRKRSKAERRIARVLFYFVNNRPIPAVWRRPGRLECEVLNSTGGKMTEQQLRKRAEKLIREGKMPTLQELSAHNSSKLGRFMRIRFAGHGAKRRRPDDQTQQY